MKRELLRRKLAEAFDSGYNRGKEDGIRLGKEAAEKASLEALQTRERAAMIQLLEAMARSMDAAAHALMSYNKQL